MAAMRAPMARLKAGRDRARDDTVPERPRTHDSSQRAAPAPAFAASSRHWLVNRNLLPLSRRGSRRPRGRILGTFCAL
jgi:hypothetical protein